MGVLEAAGCCDDCWGVVCAAEVCCGVLEDCWTSAEEDAGGAAEVVAGVDGVGVGVGVGVLLAGGADEADGVEASEAEGVGVAAGAALEVPLS